MTIESIPRLVPGDFLRKAREFGGLSQGELAARMGVTLNTIRRAEAAEVPPKLERIMAWATATGTDWRWLRWNLDACSTTNMPFDFQPFAPEVVHPLGLEPRTRCLTGLSPDQRGFTLAA